MTFMKHILFLSLFHLSVSACSKEEKTGSDLKEIHKLEEPHLASEITLSTYVGMAQCPRGLYTLTGTELKAKYEEPRPSGGCNDVESQINLTEAQRGTFIAKLQEVILQKAPGCDSDYMSRSLSLKFSDKTANYEAISCDVNEMTIKVKDYDFLLNQLQSYLKLPI